MGNMTEANQIRGPGLYIGYIEDRYFCQLTNWISVTSALFFPVNLEHILSKISVHFSFHSYWSALY